MFNFKNPPKKTSKGKEETKTLHLSFGGKTYAVPTTYKTVKHMRMHVHRDGTLTLSVPLGTKQKDIERFCREKEQRILGHLQSITARPVAYASLPVKDGDSFPCFGETLLVTVEKGNRAEVRREGKRLQLTLRNPENGDAVNRLFAKWQKETTKAYMTIAIEAVASDAASSVKAALKADDIINSITIDGKEYKVTRMFHVVDTMLNARVDSSVVFNVTRGGETLDVSLKLTQDMLTKSV